MDNTEIKEMFDKLQTFVEKTIEEGKSEHKEIKDLLRKLCDRMTSSESTLGNHLINTEKKAKSQKEKTHLAITVISLAIASIAIISNFL